MYTPSPTDIAVIGMAGRFPGAQNVARYWQNLRNGVESVTFLSDDELRASGIPDDVLADPDYVRASYPLEGADKFDAAFFGYNPREARFIDPQQRVLLECAWHALEDAGYADGKPRPVGVYVGSSLNTYLLFTGLAEKFKTEPVLTLMSSDKDFLATRIGYKLQLEGPCVTVQSACSTSLVAIHQACQSILSHECDMALAGGVCVKVPLKAGYLYREGGMLSKDGHCRAFDSAATGTIFGSGAAIVVLKRYSEALKDGDRIDAIIRGSAINNDGARKASYTAPSVVGLAEVIEQSMDFAGVTADQISFVECHGTGTALGDPIEVHALTKAFRASTQREGYCALGSVKSNVGHLEAASGVASFVKVVCCLKERALPRTLHFREPNPALGLSGSPFFVNACHREWSPGEAPRIGAVNSLGVGGTNANVILQEAPPREPAASRRKWHLLPVSSRSVNGIRASYENLVTHFEQRPALSAADAAFTLSTGRRSFNKRDAVFINGGLWRPPAPTLSSGLPLDATRRPIVFLFGNEVEPSSAIDASWEDEPLSSELRRSIDAAVQAGRGLPSQLALAEFWKLLGVIPQATIGDGRGRLAAAHAAGLTSPPDHLESLKSIEPGAVYFSPDRAPAPPDALDSVCRFTLDRHPDAIIVPIGSHSALSESMSRAAANSPSHPILDALMTNHSSEDEPPALLQQTALLWKMGAPIDISRLYAGEQRTRVALPVSVLESQRFWF